MQFKINLVFLVLLIAINYNNFVNCESIELLKVESDIISGLEQYINEYETKIDRLRSNLEDLKKEHEEANEDITRYLSNPINAYLLTKRLTTDWKHVENMISADQSLEFFKNLSSNYGSEKLPSEEDLRNEILRLERLRKTYDLPLQEVANGYLDGVKYSDPLRAVDCFEIGRQLYYSEKYQSADDWLSLAIKMFDYSEFPTADDGDMAKASILDYYSMTQYKFGNYQTALNLAAEAIILYPEFDHIKENIRKIRKSITEEKVPITTGGVKNMKKEFPISEDQIKYEKGCRGELFKTPVELTSLYCENFSGKSAFLKLAPFKLEIMNLQPKIILVHDILNNHEINKFINMAEGRMSIANLLDQYKGIEVAYPTRSSEYYVMNKTDLPIILNLNQRIADITGLIVNNSTEDLQISKYDVGGHYTPHDDYMFEIGEKPVDLSEELGNRIVNTIIYLNDVEKGGATLFPKLDTVVFPKKAAALIWYNILPNGKPDLDIQHAGCPVLKGNKWILTKSIRERDQMLNRPCSYNENDRYE